MSLGRRGARNLYIPALYNQSIELLDWKLGQHWKIAQACATGTGFEATVLGLEGPKTLFDMNPAVIDIAYGLAFSFFFGGGGDFERGSCDTWLLLLFL